MPPHIFSYGPFQVKVNICSKMEHWLIATALFVMHSMTSFWVVEARSLGLPDHRSSRHTTFVCGVMSDASCLTCLADDLKQRDSTAVEAVGTETPWRVWSE
jgi:hypothetical protein